MHLPFSCDGSSGTASWSWAWARSQLTRSPLRQTAQGADEGVDRSVDGWVDLESTLEPRTAPPHLSFQLAHDPDYPPPTYVKG